MRGRLGSWVLLLVVVARASGQGDDGGGGGGLRSNWDDSPAGAIDGLASDPEVERSLDDIEGDDDDYDGTGEEGDDEDDGKKVGIVKKLISKLKKEKSVGGVAGEGEGGGGDEGGGEAKAGSEAGGGKGSGDEPYYCHHGAACGSRGHINSGPATSDTLHNGYECFCRGPAQLGLKANCYRGHCYNPAMQSETYRASRGVDTNGMCSYLLSSNSAADTAFCEVEPAENADPNLRSFTDPPFLVNPEEEQAEIAVATRVGSEAMS